MTKIYYYGGKFNPFTKGHMNAVKFMLDYGFSHANLANGSALPFFLIGFTEDTRPGIINVAMHFIKDYAIKNYSVEYSRQILSILDCTYKTYDQIHSKQFTEWFAFAGITDYEVTLVLGEDEVHDLNEGKWYKSEDVLKECKILEVPRNDGISSTKVREILKANPYADYGDVSYYIEKKMFDVIKEFGMYDQYGYEFDYRRKENNFIAGYSADKYPKASVTADNIFFKTSKDGDFSIFEDGKIQILLIRRKNMPYQHFWALPGGFFDVKTDADIYETSKREAKEEVGFSTDIFLRKGTILDLTKEDRYCLYDVSSKLGNDPRDRVVDVIFAYHVPYYREFKAGDDAAELAWFDVDNLPRLAFNHEEIITNFIKDYSKVSK